ncbi:hypothetical protein BU24DRAFT_424010 [Aaosphaeria arxii CBS 175.79]|uniref:RING-type domain-containing protein n=1 Tax=Aaosphaeria arxii CBS 175.79 TaxID=1450172 RepID=A0A6A5XS62_9PLEO|nr:uncharacterized protein BU24DRAFT_424010 [Aaosphaeria arxii CBS 175.79]KAF2015104.1 hypothetical protein BU24DRAFT_424010 [Aaosphaeria arxii CBS 175.79]
MSDYHSLNDPNNPPPRPIEFSAPNNDSSNTNPNQGQPNSSTDSPALWSFDDIVDLPPSPTPPSPPLPPPRSAAFLDQILNPGPAPASSSSFFTPSTVFRQDFDFSRRPAADVSGATQNSSYSDTSMPPARSSRASRRNSGVVDLTDDPDPPARRLSAQSGGAGPSAKRRKRSDGGAVPAVSKDKKASTVEIGEVDLTEENTPLKEALDKQRADAVKAQQKPEEKATNFNTLTCVICMDTPTDLTATSCGHIFCHSCLMEALIAGEERSAPGEPRRSQCPVCRKHISRTKQTDIIPLLLMKGLATQPRKKLRTTT